MLGQQHVAHVSRILRQVHVLDKAMMMLVRMYQQHFLGCAQGYTEVQHMKTVMLFAMRYETVCTRTQPARDMVT